MAEQIGVATGTVKGFKEGKCYIFLIWFIHSLHFICVVDQVSV